MRRVVDRLERRCWWRRRRAGRTSNTQSDTDSTTTSPTVTPPRESNFHPVYLSHLSIGSNSDTAPWVHLHSVCPSYYTEAANCALGRSLISTIAFVRKRIIGIIGKGILHNYRCPSCHLTNSTALEAWCSGNGVGRINEVTLRRARLVLGWVTCTGSTPGGGTLFRYLTSHAGRLSLSSFWGR